MSWSVARLVGTALDGNPWRIVHFENPDFSGWDLSVEVEMTAEGLNLTKLVLEAKDNSPADGAITPRLLSSIRIRPLRNEIAWRAATPPIPHSGGMTDLEDGQVALAVEGTARRIRAPVWWDESNEPPQPLSYAHLMREPRQGRGGQPPIFWARIAVRYVELVGPKGFMSKLAEEFGRTPSQMADLVRRCRRLGYLTEPPRRNRPGGEITDLTREVLEGGAH